MLTYSNPAPIYSDRRWEKQSSVYKALLSGLTPVLEDLGALLENEHKKEDLSDDRNFHSSGA